MSINGPRGPIGQCMLRYAGLTDRKMILHMRCRLQFTEWHPMIDQHTAYMQLS